MYIFNCWWKVKWYVIELFCVFLSNFGNKNIFQNNRKELCWSNLFSLYDMFYVLMSHTCQKSRDPGSRIPSSGRRPLQRLSKVAAADNSHRSCQRTLQRPRSGRYVLLRSTLKWWNSWSLQTKRMGTKKNIYFWFLNCCRSS